MTKSHLEFILSEEALQLVEINDSNPTILGTLRFQGKKDFQYKEQISQFLTEHSIQTKEYDDYSLSWHTPYSTLIPMNVFGVSDPRTIFQACFAKDMVSNDVDYNRISELSLVNIYEIPLWIKSFFVIRFPRIIIQHEGSHFLRGIFNQSTFKTSFHLVLHANHCLLICVKHNNLLFFNHFESLNEDDILYYLTVALQQQQLTQDESQLYVYTGPDAPNSLQEAILVKIKLLKDLQKMKVMETKLLPFKYQNTCV